MLDLQLLLLSHPESDEPRARRIQVPLKVAFPPVCPNELGFALTLFVAAANRQIRSPHLDSPTLHECEQIFLQLSAHHQAPKCQVNPAAREADLQSAFFVLWDLYQGHPLQRSICARVLGFYFLMERTRGEALQEWIDVCPDRPEAVSLHPAVVEALAIVPLDQTGSLDQQLYLTVIEGMARYQRPSDLVA
jgi:hypothetical protein